MPIQLIDQFSCYEEFSELVDGFFSDSSTCNNPVSILDPKIRSSETNLITEQHQITFGPKIKTALPSSNISAVGLVAKDSKFMVSGTEFRTFRHHFNSSHLAAQAGYLSKSQWYRAGRDVVSVEKPTLCVSKSWQTYHPADEDVILGYSQLNEYLVTNGRFFPVLGSLGCWSVFHITETVPKAIRTFKTPINEKELESREIVVNNNQIISRTVVNSSPLDSSCYSYTSSPSPLPYDGENTIKLDVKPSSKKDLQQDYLRTRLIRKPLLTKRKKGRDIEVYFPERFDWSEYPQLQPFRSSVMWIAHKLHERRFVNIEGNIYSKDEFISLKTTYAREIDPDFRHAIKILLDLEIMERNFYQPDIKSYGYRFKDTKIRYAKHKRVPLNDPKLSQRINNHRKKHVTTRTDRWLRSHLFKLGLVDMDGEFLETVANLSVVEKGGTIGDKLEAYRYVLQRISKQEHLWASDDQGRRYNLITNLKRELRSLLRVDGQRLQQIDISNSQLTFLALEMKQHGVECPGYFDLCEKGELYEVVASHSETTRSDVKKAITQRALFSTNEAACQKSKIKRTFDRLFPDVAEYLRKVKEMYDGHSQLAKSLQSAEADLIINSVCGRLRREGRVNFVSPIHDCLMFLPEDAEYVKSVMEYEFSKLEIHPRLKIKEL